MPCALTARTVAAVRSAGPSPSRFACSNFGFRLDHRQDLAAVPVVDDRLLILVVGLHAAAPISAGAQSAPVMIRSTSPIGASWTTKAWTISAR